MQGDEQATETLRQLDAEAGKKRDEAMFKLRALASGGNVQAKEMLVQLAQWLGVTQASSFADILPNEGNFPPAHILAKETYGNQQHGSARGNFNVTMHGPGGVSVVGQ